MATCTSYIIEIKGETALLMHCGSEGLNQRSPAALEMKRIYTKKASNRTEDEDKRLQELECLRSLWLDQDRRPTIPPYALRAMLEESAKKTKQGAQVRGGLIVTESLLNYDKTELGETPEEIALKAQFTIAVRVNNARNLRTRARFEKWGCVFRVEAEDDLVDEVLLKQWLTVGGRRIGIGDWRPSKSGDFGRFSLVRIEREG